MVKNIDIEPREVFSTKLLDAQHICEKEQISNFVYCDKSVLDMDLETKFLPNQYHDYPYIAIEGFLSEEKCKLIIDSIKKDENFETAMVKNTINGVVKPKVNKGIRKTKIYKLSKTVLSIYQNSFIKFQNQIEKHYSIALTQLSKPQLLSYNIGDFYSRHADDSNEIVNDKKETIGFNQIAPYRKITTVLFLSSHTEYTVSENEFCGGELVFNYLYDENNKNIVFRPKAGTMIVFPSNPIFSHEVLPVLEGKRMTLVQWHNAILE